MAIFEGFLKNRKSQQSVAVMAFVLILFPLQTLIVGAASIPSAPLYVEAMASSNQVAVTWDPPGSTGGDTLLTYSVRVWTVPPPTSSPVFASCTTTKLGCVIGGLTSGATYYVDVVAGNSAGIGGPSAARPITPGSAGVPPTGVSASIDSKGFMTVNWTPLTSFSGATFAWYTAEAFEDSEISAGSYKGYCTATTIGSSNCLIGGLKIGTAYYVQVRTVSSIGSSFPSTPRYKVSAAPSATTSAKPSPSSTNSTVKLTAPQQVKVVALSKSVRVSWKAPSVTGGKVILNYSVGAYTAKGAIITTCKTLPKVFTCTIKGLKPNQRAYFGVIARYSDSVSPMSKLISAIPKS